MVIVISGQLDYSVSPSQVGLRTLGLGLDTNTAGPYLLAVNICYTIMSSFVLWKPTSDLIFSEMHLDIPGFLGLK